MAVIGAFSAGTVFGDYEKVSSHGVDIHYRIFGDGEPLLIIGGGPGDVSDRYLSLCELLSQNFKCILVDQRGTGKSTPQPKDETTVTVALTLNDFEAIRNQLKLKTWNILGFSYGGYLASAYAAFFPASIKSVLLLDSSGLNDDYAGHFSDNITSRMLPQDLWVYNYWADPARMNADKQHAITEIIRSMMPGYFFDRKKSLLVSQIIKDSDFDFETGALIEKDIAKRQLDISKIKPGFKGSVLILHGRQDPVGESVPQKLAHYYSKSTLIFIEKAGHYSWIEQPEKVLTAIVEYLSPKTVSNSIGIETILIKSGSFVMGSPDGEGNANEHPQHTVRINKPFYVGKYPVTVAQFERFITESGYKTTAETGNGAWVWPGKKDWEKKTDASWKNPYFSQTATHPVVCVSWNDAKAFCAWLSKKEGKNYRLLTEAEFEYVCRAGTSTAWFFGSESGKYNDFGWPQALTSQGFPTHPVGQKKPNPWGVYDIIGNVWQWCEDWYGEKYYTESVQKDPMGAINGTDKVNRGGMGDDPIMWRSAARDMLSPDLNYSNQGFRIVMELITDVKK